MSERVFNVTKPLMQGEDVKNWQKDMLQAFNKVGIKFVPLNVDGVYGPTTRSLTAVLCKCYGMREGTVMRGGVTRALRLRIRDRRLTATEEKRFASDDYKHYRGVIRHKWAAFQMAHLSVHTPLTKILADSWGYHPGVHDGLDLICPPNAILFAMIRSKVIDVRSGGWWGKAPSGNVALGDGIVQLEVLESIGPFKKGMHIGYGHAEKAVVKVGQIVQAGEPLARAGLAVAWHVHLMVNTGGTKKGIGNLDPRKFYEYAVKNG